MAYTDRVEHQVEIRPNGLIQVRAELVIERDGVEIARTYHRHVVEPGQDVSQQPPMVQTIAPVIWTDQVVEDYRRKKQESQLPAIIKES
jgi:hypothetical protein